MLLLPVVARAELADFTCKSPITAKQAAEILRSTQQQYANILSVKAKFSQDSFMAALEASERSSGNLWFKRPGLMRWQYSSPEPQEFIIRDKTMWFYQEREKQVLVDHFRDVLMSDLPVSFLLGIGDLERSFAVDRACMTPSGTLLFLKPRLQTNENLQSFELLLDDKFRPTGAKVRDVGGNTTSILLSEISFDANIEDDKFSATFPKGVDINDRRLES